MSVKIGDPLARREDERFLSGRGRYVDDIQIPGLLHAQVVRSTHAHARIVSVEAGAARAMPGVRLVLTAQDIQVGAIPLDFPPPGPAGRDPNWQPALQPVLAADTVRYVGEPIAFVVAETLQQARDAAEAVEVDFEALPAVATIEQAAGATEPLWPQFPGNIAFHYEIGDAAAAATAIASAEHRVRARFEQNRVVANPIEPRSALAAYDAQRDDATLYVGTQRPHGFRETLAQDVLGIPLERLRVATHDVGGGFGAKNSLYPEYALCLLAARRLAAPVKWVATRSEAMISDLQARENVFDLELGLDREGRFLGLQVTRQVNLGAYTSPRTFIPTYNGLALLAGFYRMDAAYARVEGVMSNTLPTTVYRGAGRPEVVHACETLIDLAARELGMDAAHLRRRNAVEENALPWVNALGAAFPVADFRQTIAQAKRMLAARPVPVRPGHLYGRGFSWFVENLHGPARARPAYLRASVDGEHLEVVVGTVSNGQGHETTLPQIVADRLQLPIEFLKFVQGDTATVPEATGTGASWSLTLAGSSLVMAADEAIRAGKEVASGLLEAGITDIAYERGAFVVAGTDRTAHWKDVFRVAPAFMAKARYDGYREGFPAACHACEVEVDPETGVVVLQRYVVAQDAGRLVNPLVAEGQLHGGVAQGVGQALLEQVAYDDDGQLLNASFMDYAMPRADSA